VRLRIERIQGAATAAEREGVASDVRGMDELVRLLDENVDDLISTPAAVISAPYRLTIQDAVSFKPGFMIFYAPAVLALLLQHFAITLGALSLARQRLLGMTELLRVSPVRPTEVVIGQYVAYGTLTLAAGSMLFALMMLTMGVPMLGDWARLAAIGVALVLTSLGIGFIISLVAQNEQQAAQISMLILLASVFLGGFSFTLDRIDWPIRAISYALPATYGIRSMQDEMLRGFSRYPIDTIALVLGAIAAFFLTLLLYRRELRPA
jgi:ABC-2 type transport system permease protein